MPEYEAGVGQPGQNVLSAGAPGAPINQHSIKMADFKSLHCINVFAKLRSCAWPA